MIPIADWCAQHGLSVRGVQDLLRDDPAALPMPVITLKRRQFVLTSEEVIALRLGELLEVLGAKARTPREPNRESKPTTDEQSIALDEPSSDGDVETLLQLIEQLPFAPSIPFGPTEADVAINACRVKRGRPKLIVDALAYGMTCGDRYWRERLAQEGIPLTKDEVSMLITESRGPDIAAHVTTLADVVIAHIKEKHPGRTVTLTIPRRRALLRVVKEYGDGEMIHQALKWAFAHGTSYLAKASFPEGKRLDAIVEEFQRRYSLPKGIDAQAQQAAEKLVSEYVHLADADVSTIDPLRWQGWVRAAAECLVGAGKDDIGDAVDLVRTYLRWSFEPAQRQYHATGEFPTVQQFQAKLPRAVAWAAGTGTSSVVAADRGGRERVVADDYIDPLRSNRRKRAST